MSGTKVKKGESVLLMPGSEGWDIWIGAGDAMSLVLHSETTLALDVSPLPAGELKMAFPLREVSSLPMMAPTTDVAPTSRSVGSRSGRASLRSWC